jgi:hypothetical protein
MDIVIKRKDGRVVITTVCDLQEIAVNMSMSQEKYEKISGRLALGSKALIIECPACANRNEYHEIGISPIELTEEMVDIAATALDISYRNET